MGALWQRIVSLQLLILVLASAVIGQSNGPIRLWRNGVTFNTYSSGRVQIFYDDRWGNICNDASFGTNEATVICHQLGYTAASTFSRQSQDSFGSDTYPIVLGSVSCSISSYLVILQCSFISYASSTSIPSSCTSGDEVSVTCLSTRIWSSPYSGQIRLSRGDTVNQGLVEVYCSGHWGTVCDDSFGINDANTVCRQLGYHSYFGYDHLSPRGSSGQPIWLDDVPCSSARACIADCTSCPTSENCGHSEDVTIECYSPSRYTGTTIDTCRGRNTEPINLGAVIGGTVGAVVVIIILIIILRHVLYTNKRQRGSFLAFDTSRFPRVVTSTSSRSTGAVVATTTTTTTSSSSQPVPTQPQEAPAAFNLPPPPSQQPASTFTYNQPNDPSITAAPPPEYGFHTNYSNYNEKKNEIDEKSDLPPPYQPPAYGYPPAPSAPDFQPTAYPASAAAYPPPTAAGFPPPIAAGYPPPTAPSAYPPQGGEGTNWSAAAYPPYPPQQ